MIIVEVIRLEIDLDFNLILPNLELYILKV